MEVPFTPEQEMRLSEIAAHTGREIDQFVRDIALSALEEDTRFRAAVRQGISAADRGEFVESGEIWANVEKILLS